MRRTKKEAEQTRLSILNAAMRVFSSKGYAGTRLEDVARAAGVTRGAVTWHFSNKANLLNAALVGGTKAYTDRLQTIIDSGLSPLNTLRALVKEMLSSLESDDVYRTSMEIIFHKSELAEELQQGWAKYVGFMNRLQRTAERLVQKGIMLGEIRPEIDPKLAALGMTAFIIGIEQYWLMDSRAFSIEKVSDRIIEFVTQAIVPNKPLAFEEIKDKNRGSQEDQESRILGEAGKGFLP